MWQAVYPGEVYTKEGAGKNREVGGQPHPLDYWLQPQFLNTVCPTVELEIF